MDIETIKFINMINSLSDKIKNGIIPLSQIKDNKNKEYLIVYDDENFEDYRNCNKKAYNLILNPPIFSNDQTKNIRTKIFISDNLENYYIIINLYSSNDKLNIVIKKDGSWNIINDKELHSIKNFKEEEVIEKTKEVDKTDKVDEILSKIHMITFSCLLAVILAKILQIYQM